MAVRGARLGRKDAGVVPRPPSRMPAMEPAMLAFVCEQTCPLLALGCKSLIAAVAASPASAAGSPGLDATASAEAGFNLPWNEQVFADFTLGRVLGKGAFGMVFMGCRHDSGSSLQHADERDVAIKVLNFLDKSDHKLRRSLLQEAVVMTGIRHPHLVATLGCAIREKAGSRLRQAVLPEGSPAVLEMWILMEACDGGTLRARLCPPVEAIRRGSFKTAAGGPALDRVFATAAEIAQALEHFHAQGVMHGDLNPANVLLAHSQAADCGFTIKVSDFGRSRTMGSRNSQHTESVGTVTHMPPELMETGKLTYAADVYSFGVLLWELFTSSLAWAGLRPTVVMYRVSVKHATLPIPASCPPLLKALMEACMDQQYQQRPSFASVSNQLAAAAAASLGAPAAAAACPPPLVTSPLRPEQGLP